MKYPKPVSWDKRDRRNTKGEHITEPCVAQTVILPLYPISGGNPIGKKLWSVEDQLPHIMDYMKKVYPNAHVLSVVKTVDDPGVISYNFAVTFA